MDELPLNDVLPLHADRLPLRVDEGGVVRVGNTRVSLDLIVEQYENGMTAEDMVRAYDTLALPEMEALLRRLGEAALCRTCAHGRPTAILLSHAQLEREFGRR